jgi:hypothetical protein
MKKLFIVVALNLTITFLVCWLFLKIQHSTPNNDLSDKIEFATGIYLTNKVRILNHTYKNTGNILMNSSGEEFSGFVELSNPYDLYSCEKVAKRLNYSKLPYTESDTIIKNLNFPCFNGNSFELFGKKKGYYRIQITEREKKIGYLDLNCGILFYYYKRGNVKIGSDYSG